MSACNPLGGPHKGRREGKERSEENARRKEEGGSIYLVIKDIGRREDQFRC
jgi:hypothetical protein